MYDLTWLTILEDMNEFHVATTVVRHVRRYRNTNYFECGFRCIRFCCFASFLNLLAPNLSYLLGQTQASPTLEGLHCKLSVDVSLLVAIHRKI